MSFWITHIYCDSPCGDPAWPATLGIAKPFYSRSVGDNAYLLVSPLVHTRSPKPDDTCLVNAIGDSSWAAAAFDNLRSGEVIEADGSSHFVFQMLASMRRYSIETNVKMSFYCSVYFGGHVDQQAAWVFSGSSISYLYSDRGDGVASCILSTLDSRSDEKEISVTAFVAHELDVDYCSLVNLHKEDAF